MPEICEVSRVVDQLYDIKKQDNWSLVNIEIFSGRYNRHGPPLNFKLFKEKLPLKWNYVQNKGKLIWFQFGEFYMFATLAMTGRFLVEPQKHSHVKFSFESETNSISLYFDDIRNFGTLVFCFDKKQFHSKLKSIGVPYLDTNYNKRQPLVKYSHFVGILNMFRNKNICIFLMDQKYFSGIGNYLLSEILHDAKIYPFKTIGELSNEDKRNLWYSICKIIHRSYLLGGVSFKDFTGIYNDKGKYQKYLKVYQKQENDNVIKKKGPHGRSIFYKQDINNINNEDILDLEPKLKKLKI